jgi:hypothetical protein
MTGDSAAITKLLYWGSASPGANSPDHVRAVGGAEV